MSLNIKEKSADQMVEAIFTLDLDPIKFKLMDKKEGQGWTREQVDRLELEYRRFLALVAKYPEEVIAPDTDVDKFWHGHILDTLKYAEDCQHIFGYFLHHFPYFGMRDEEDAANLVDAAANTRRLYQLEFGADAAANAAYCARVAGPVQSQEKDAAYCARVAGPVQSQEKDAAYCARVAGPVQSREKDAAYCARVAGPVQSQEKDAAYCARVAGPAQSQDKDAAYCAAPSADYYSKILGKGRPALEGVAA